MKTSESIKAISKALTGFQRDLEEPTKDAANPFFKNKYVTLDKLLESIRPALIKNGLSFVQSPGGDGETITVTTLLMHESGEWIECDPLALKAAKVDPQGAGSAVTYARRYSLSAVLGVTWDEDDDGAKASNVPLEKRQTAKATPQKGQEEDVSSVLRAIADGAKKHDMPTAQITELIYKRYGKSSSKELTMQQALDLKKHIDQSYAAESA